MTALRRKSKLRVIPYRGMANAVYIRFNSVSVIDTFFSTTPFAAQIRRVFTHFGTSESIVVNLQS